MNVQHEIVVFLFLEYTLAGTIATATTKMEKRKDNVAFQT